MDIDNIDNYSSKQSPSLSESSKFVENFEIQHYRDNYMTSSVDEMTLWSNPNDYLHVRKFKLILNRI